MTFCKNFFKIPNNKKSGTGKSHDAGFLNRLQLLQKQIIQFLPVSHFCFI